MSQVIVDDLDPRVIHTGNWTVGGTVHENNGTVSSTTTPGSSLSLTFNGTAISVYGTIDASSAGVTTTYTIDSGNPDTVVSVAGQGDTYRQLFFSSDSLSNQQHSLVVTVIKVNTNSPDGPGEGTIWFDYFNITSTSSQVPSSNTASPAGATSTPSSSHSGASRVEIGAIVGGVIAGLFVLGFLIAWLIWRRQLRRKRRKSFVVDPLTQQTLLPDGSSWAPNEQPPVFHPHVTPFAAPPPPSTTGFLTQSVAPSTHSRPTHHTHNASMSILHTTTTTMSPPMSVPGSSTHTPQLAPSRSTAKRRERLVVLAYNGDDDDDDDDGRVASASAPPVITQHVDSGLRAGSIDAARPGAVIELPPVYTAT